MKHKSITRAISVLLAALFAYAAIYKLITFTNFSIQLDKVTYISGYSTLIAFLIPALELLVAVLLFRPLSRLAGLFGAFFLINIYTVYLLAMLNKGHQMSCDCGELWAWLTLGQHLILNLVMIVLSSVAVILSGRAGYPTGEIYN